VLAFATDSTLPWGLHPIARFDRKSISVIVLGALFYAIYLLLIFHLTVRCPDGLNGIVVTRPGLNVKKMCEKAARREQKQDDEE